MCSQSKLGLSVTLKDPPPPAPYSAPWWGRREGWLILSLPSSSCSPLAASGSCGDGSYRARGKGNCLATWLSWAVVPSGLVLANCQGVHSGGLQRVLSSMGTFCRIPQRCSQHPCLSLPLNNGLPADLLGPSSAPAPSTAPRTVCSTARTPFLIRQPSWLGSVKPQPVRLPSLATTGPTRAPYILHHHTVEKCLPSFTPHFALPPRCLQLASQQTRKFSISS